MLLHVNAIEGRRNLPLRGDSIKNCAACTAAGAVNLTIGHSEISSGHVAKVLNKPDGRETMGDDVKYQRLEIAKYVYRKTGRKAAFGPKQGLDSAEKWMRSQPDKTVFAVLADGYVPHDGEPKCHWLNAILLGGTIRYFDFQPMRASARGGDFVGHANPATSTKPFVGVITQAQDNASDNTTAVRKQMQSSHQAGSFDKSVQLTLIAFPPK